MIAVLGSGPAGVASARALLDRGLEVTLYDAGVRLEPEREAVVERLDIKKNLYKQIDEVRKSGSIVSSNTSTIPISLLVEGMPESFRQEFAITHFFNPVRFM